MSSSFIINLDEAGIAMRLYRFTSAFNKMFWKIKPDPTPTNLCPFLRTVFFFPGAALSLLYLAYSTFFWHLRVFLTQVFGDAASRNIVISIAICAGAVALLLFVLNQINESIKHVRRQRRSKKREEFERSLSRSHIQKPEKVTPTKTKEPATSTLWQLIAAWFESLHTKTCVPIGIVKSPISGGQ